MRIGGWLIIGMAAAMASPLHADTSASSGVNDAGPSADLGKHEKRLERIQADRSVDAEHARLAQQELATGTAQMSVHDAQKGRDAEHLVSVESQVRAGQVRRELARQTYKKARRQYAPGDPRREAAKRNWEESRQAMGPLLQSRGLSRDEVHRGNRQVHDDRIVLGVQKRAISSDARYSASNDRKILREENAIAVDRRLMAQDVQSSEISSSK